MTERATYGEAIGEKRLRELSEQYIEIVPDNGDPNAADFRRDVSLEQAREVGEGPEAMWAYICLYYFVWREQMYCRRCGCPVLAAWMVQHKEEVHALRFGL